MGEAEISMFGIKVSGLEVRNVCNRGEDELNGSEELVMWNLEMFGMKAKMGDVEVRNSWNGSEE